MILLEEKDISAQCDPKTKRVPRLQFDYLDFLYILIFCTYSQALLRHLPREMEMRDVELADTKMGVTHQVTVEATAEAISQATAEATAEATHMQCQMTSRTASRTASQLASQLASRLASRLASSLSKNVFF